MNIINALLNLACVFLWIEWISAQSSRQQSALSIANTIRPAGGGARRSIGALAGLIVILLLRPMFYYSVGPAAHWTASLNLTPIAIPFRSDSVLFMYLYSTLSFLVAFAFYYSWMLLLSAVDSRLARTPEEETMSRFVRTQLGWLDKVPWWLKLCIPSIAAAICWTALSILLVELELLPVAQSNSALRGQAGAFALAAILAWKWLLIAIFLLHMLNIYVYLGTHPLWAYISMTARRVLKPFSFLQFGKVDLSPIAGAAAVFVLAEFVLKPFVSDIFQRHIV